MRLLLFLLVFVPPTSRASTRIFLRDPPFPIPSSVVKQNPEPREGRGTGERHTDRYHILIYLGHFRFFR